MLLGQVYLGLKDPKAAEDQFEAALLLQSNNSDAVLGLATAQVAEGNFVEAVQQLEPLAKIRAKNAVIFELLAKAYSGLGNTAKAQQAEAQANLLRQHPK
jgi:predicted Zn-dependent protease